MTSSPEAGRLMRTRLAVMGAILSWLLIEAQLAVDTGGVSTSSLRDEALVTLYTIYG